MATLRNHLKQKGFTLIEILVVIVIIGVLSIMGVSKYTEFTTQSRIRGCCSNQNAIDKAIGVWEAQNVAIPITADHTVSFKSNGKLAAAASFDAIVSVPSGERMVADSSVILEYNKDMNVFTCPERFNVVGQEIYTGKAEIEYNWISKTKGSTDPDLNGKSRGTKCTAYVAKGPDGTSGVGSSWHRP